MNYLVTARAARLATGVLTLTAAQASVRRHALVSLGSGRYQIAAPVEFKSGEVIGYVGDLPKVLADILVDPAAPEAKPEAKPVKPKKAKPAAHPVAQPEPVDPPPAE